MTIKWLRVVGGSDYGPDGPLFSGTAEARSQSALTQVEDELAPLFDGQRWLAQGGYERIMLTLDYRLKKGRQLSSLTEVGRLLKLNFSLAWPELERATVEEIRDHLRPIVLEALEFVGERKGLGKLPKSGEGEDLEVVPLKPLIDDPAPYAEEPGDSFVITREFPAGVDPSDVPHLLRRYEEELEALLSDEAMENIVDTETSPTAVRWVVQAGPTDD